MQKQHNSTLPGSEIVGQYTDKNGNTVYTDKYGPVSKDHPIYQEPKFAGGSNQGQSPKPKP